MNKETRFAFLEKTIVGILLGLVFLLPVFFLPLDGVFFGFAKNILLGSALISALMLTLVLWIKEGKIVFPKSPLFIILFILVVVYILSSLLSGSFSNSFFGTGGETTTSFEFLLLGISLLLFAIFFRTKERVFHAFAALFVSALFVFLFQIFHFIFPGLSISGMSPDKTVNLVGAWSDLGIFSGIIAILSLVALEKLPYIGTVARGILYLFLVIALFFHALVFYSDSWLILFVTASAISVFVFLRRRGPVPEENMSPARNQFLTPSFVVAALSLLFVFIGPQVNGKLFELLNIQPIQDVRPSFTGTYLVSRGLYAEKSNTSKKEVLFGAGPNRFFVPWQKYRPKEVNYTPWWGVDFNEGIGAIPSTAVCVGLLGFFGWVIFLLVFFLGGLRAMGKKLEQMDAFTQCILAASFAAASYAWTAIFLNTVGTVPFALAFIFTGLFLGTLSASGAAQVRDYNYSEAPRAGFSIVVILILLLGSSAVLGYHAIEKTRSFFAYRNAVFAGASGNFEKSSAEFQKAILLAPNDAYYRSFSVLNSYHAQELLLRKDLSAAELRDQFGASFAASITSANKSTELDGANYQNWLTLGNAYSLLVPLNIENISADAYVKAKAAYEEAEKRNPFNPQIPYMIARLALSKNQPNDAIIYAKSALDLKNDYADALILVSQIEDAGGHSSEALATMEGASAFNFSDPTILFQLGYLRYKNGNYKEAASALEKAVQAAPDYANAKYFLGLSYFEFGRTDDALKEFTDIEHSNPDRADITQIVNNLQNGYKPLSSPTPLNTPTLLVASTTEKEKAARKER